MVRRQQHCAAVSAPKLLMPYALTLTNMRSENPRYVDMHDLEVYFIF